MAHNDRKWLIFPTLPLLDAPLGEPLRSSGWNLPCKY